MRVFISGGTGSLGRALTERFLKDGSAERIVLFSRGEHAQAEMAAEFAPRDPDGKLRFFLGDIRDEARLRRALRGIDVVIGAAALKRVDKVAYDPDEGILTNVLGTMATIHAATDAGVKKVLIVSSDKSVLSSNAYGATKFLAEHYAVASNALSAPAGTLVSAVRYGNVINSRGAVLHRFRELARQGEPLTITDTRMTRFVMTLEQAVDLIEQSLAHMRGGEVFLPRLPSMRTVDLAEAVAPGGWMEFTGLRPGGEKLAEVLISEHESDRVKYHEALGLYILEPSHSTWGYRPWPGATLKAGYRYDSESNPEWLSVEELRTMVEGT